MKYKRTETEVKEICKAMGNCFPNMKGVIVLATTTKEFAREVLPAHLDIDETPIVSFNIGESTLFDSMTVSISCSYKGEPGFYGLGFILNNDHSTIYGRELWGEPKKLGDISYSREGGKVVATASRFGKELVRIEAEMLMEVEDHSSLEVMRNYHHKYTLAADGSGIDDPQLVEVMFKNDVRKLEGGQGTIVCNETDHDIYGDIPVTSIVQVACYDVDCYAKGRTVTKDIDPKELEANAFFKYDDYRLLGY